MDSLDRVTFATFDGSLVKTAAVKWANTDTDGGAWYIWSSPMVLPKTTRRANFLMKEALSIDCTLAKPGVEAVARMKVKAR